MCRYRQHGIRRRVVAVYGYVKRRAGGGGGAAVDLDKLVDAVPVNIHSLGGLETAAGKECAACRGVRKAGNEDYGIVRRV